jgi:hypothetical protein
MNASSKENLITGLHPIRGDVLRRMHGGKVYVGKRGGNFVNRHGRKVYLGNKAYKTAKDEPLPKYRLYKGKKEK